MLRESMVSVPRTEDMFRQQLTSRQAFLEILKSPGKLDYKRYTASPLRYAGGKSLGVGYVIERLPDKVKCVVSPFLGGGSVEIALANELGIEVLAFDVFDELCNYWTVQLSFRAALVRRLRDMEPSRETFSVVKKRLEHHWKRSGPRMNRYDAAAHYYFNSNTSYGPHFLGWPSDIYLEPVRYARMVEKVEAFKAPKLKVECADFEKAIMNHSSEFLYCDPPYYLDEGATFCGMYPHRNFPIHHKGFRHDRLRDLLLNHKPGFILSYNDCDIIREWYADCEIFAPQWQYTFGQGDTRIGANREKLNGGSHVKKSHELLIWRVP